MSPPRRRALPAHRIAAHLGALNGGFQVDRRRAPAALLAAAILAAGCASPVSTSREWEAFQRQAALRMVAANPKGTYMGPVPDTLLAIPVIEIELNADGSVRSTRVVRTPSQATDTIQLAIDAIRRAAPYGNMSRLSKPWKFTEVFLFDDERRFKPRTLDD